MVSEVFPNLYLDNANLGYNFQEFKQYFPEIKSVCVWFRQLQLSLNSSNSSILAKFIQ